MRRNARKTEYLRPALVLLVLTVLAIGSGGKPCLADPPGNASSARVATRKPLKSPTRLRTVPTVSSTSRHGSQGQTMPVFTPQKKKKKVKEEDEGKKKPRRAAPAFASLKTNREGVVLGSTGFFPRGGPSFREMDRIDQERQAKRRVQRRLLQSQRLRERR